MPERCKACNAQWVILKRGKLVCDWCGTINEGCCEGEKPVAECSMSQSATSVYIAGPMLHRKWFNYPAFDAFSDFLRGYGLKVYSPADMDRERGFDAMSLPEFWDWDVLPDNLDMTDTMADCAMKVGLADCLLMLDGWHQSRGAKWEFDLACMRRKPIFFNTGDVLKFAGVK